METDSDSMHDDLTNKHRRAFLKTSGKAAAVAPAIGLLLASGSKPAAAVETYDGTQVPGGCGCGA